MALPMANWRRTLSPLGPSESSVSRFPPAAAYVRLCTVGGAVCGDGGVARSDDAMRAAT